MTTICHIYCHFTSPMNYLKFLQLFWSVKSRSETQAVW